jgi:2-polyprenyl-6-hydroxyphenyl methylase/3-demethylubiquinone-9 3-methyltransferase
MRTKDVVGRASNDDLYVSRPLARGYPGLAQAADETFASMHAHDDDDAPRIDRLLTRFHRLTGVPDGARIAVVGCGPVPQPVRVLRERGYEAVGIEPVRSFVERANRYLGGQDLVLTGAAESIPLADGSQDVVFLESVLEHVDSPEQSLSEVFRVLRPGGLVYVTTTNRLALGYPDNGEYTVPLFGKLPRLVRESYIFQHLHYQPSLARYTERPAVHWFTFADLCELGRRVGFHQFYNSLDLRRPDDVLTTDSRWKRLVARRLMTTIQRSPWLRAIALTQMGGEIIMLKRDVHPSSTTPPAQVAG